MVFDTSGVCRRKLDDLLLQHTYWVNGRGNDANHKNARDTFIDTIMNLIRNKNFPSVIHTPSSVHTPLSFGCVQCDHHDDLFTGIANAISGQHVKLHIEHKRDGRGETKSYVCSWNIEKFSCKFYTEDMGSFLSFCMEIVNHNNEDESSAVHSASNLKSMFTILQNMHDRLTKLESSFPRTRSCPRQLE